MNRKSNLYIIVYSTVMVVIVAAVLSFAAIGLRPQQQENVENAKKADILRSVGLLKVAGKHEAPVVVADEYDKYIKQTFLVRTNGEVVKDADSKEAFNVFINLDREYFKGKPTENSRLPIFVSIDNAGVKRYVFPVQGTGLWGAIWGYVALADDFNTITGVVFDHASETPGLGAEIAAAPFQNQFIGKQIFEGDTYVGIEILKGAGASVGNVHAVDAVSGGTITSRAVSQMLDDSLGGYEAYLKDQRALVEDSSNEENI